jgi:hypothetical protein
MQCEVEVGYLMHEIGSAGSRLRFTNLGFAGRARAGVRLFRSVYEWLYAAYGVSTNLVLKRRGIIIMGTDGGGWGVCLVKA